MPGMKIKTTLWQRVIVVHARYYFGLGKKKLSDGDQHNTTKRTLRNKTKWPHNGMNERRKKKSWITMRELNKLRIIFQQLMPFVGAIFYFIIIMAIMNLWRIQKIIFQNAQMKIKKKITLSAIFLQQGQCEWQRGLFFSLRFEFYFCFQFYLFSAVTSPVFRNHNSDWIVRWYKIKRNGYDQKMK